MVSLLKANISQVIGCASNRLETCRFKNAKCILNAMPLQLNSEF